MNNTLDPIKLVIVEDEPISSTYLKKQINDIGIDYQVVAEIARTTDATAFFTSNKDYDLVFMDIHLEDGDCFKLLNEVTIEKPIVFCTTFDSYALKAFKYNSIDYLLKPVNKDDVEIALKKYLSLKKIEDNSHFERMDKMMETIAPTEYKERFLVRKANKLKLVHTDDVVCFYSNEGDTRLIEKNGSEHIIDYTVERLEKLMNPKYYFRINRKMCININYLHSVEDYFNNRLKIMMQKKMPFDLIVSRNRAKGFKVWLKGIS
ncbi:MULTISPECIES: LytR/AlgR family response regulator transcription factor [unclassified Croceitalea]|uniref:LytR/AlgR family response regulator transcription factor n=1 Tax=unclassified Croceitalea TaxID=2632280 RepID=UPI0030DAE349